MNKHFARHMTEEPGQGDSPSPPLPPSPSPCPNPGSFALEILIDSDNWPLGPLFFFFSHALNSSSYILNSSVKSKPMKA